MMIYNYEGNDGERLQRRCRNFGAQRVQINLSNLDGSPNFPGQNSTTARLKLVVLLHEEGIASALTMVCSHQRNKRSTALDEVGRELAFIWMKLE